MIAHIGTLIFEGLYGLLMAYITYTIFAWTPPAIVKAREALRLPRWFWSLAGVVALIGAVGLLVGLFSPLIGALAAVWMVCYFIVASLTHVVRNDLRNVGMPIFFLLLSVGLTALLWGNLAPALHLL